jgi:hypothetical protein
MMSRRYVLIPVLVSLVVLAISLYPSETFTQRASASPRSAVIYKHLMIPAAAFHIDRDGENYRNLGNVIYVDGGDANFIAPVYLPSGARIKMIKLFAYDANTTFDICAKMFVTYPKTGGKDRLVTVCTDGDAGYQQPIKFFPHIVRWYYGYYINLYNEYGANLSVNAVMIRYTVNQ